MLFGYAIGAGISSALGSLFALKNRGTETAERVKWWISVIVVALSWLVITGLIGAALHYVFRGIGWVVSIARVLVIPMRWFESMWRAA